MVLCCSAVVSWFPTIRGVSKGSQADQISGRAILDASFTRMGHLGGATIGPLILSPFSRRVFTRTVIWQEGCGVLAQMVGNSTISHNEIGWFRYTGVSVGWTWGYGPTVVHDVITSYNHIHDIGMGYLSDMGCVYGNVDIFGQSLTHFSALQYPARAALCAPLGAHAHWVLIGACNPMLCPIHGFKKGTL